MAEENGTLLARQVRRFIEKFPTSKSLENVEESAKKAILQLGNPGHYADESEKILPIPIELHNKRTFESQYKKLQKEYPTLPDLKGKDKGKGQDKEKDGEEREKKEREERERKEREERERKEREERERKEREERDRKEKEGQERKEREERERKEDGERERKEREERERMEREERETKEKEEREKKDRGNNQSNVLDQLRAIPVEQLRGLLKDLGVPSRESSVTSERTSNTSLQGSMETSADSSLQESRETSVNATSSWNTRGSSVDTSIQASGRWKRVRETLGDDTAYWLSSLSEICEDNDCDFADVKFYLEYLLRQDSDRTNSELTDLAIEFINGCPGSQARFLKDLSENDPQLKRAYDKYYTPAQSLGETKERRAWARNPQAYRDRAFEGLPPEDDEHWDQITLHFDPDTRKKNVKGRITASVAEFLDVCLPSLNGNNEERHYLALKSDYPQETRRFEDSDKGRLLTMKPQPKGSLRGRLKSDIKILNYSCADQPYPDANPRMYFFGIDKKKKKIIKAWARTTYCETKEFKGGLDDLNDQRKACGQKEITTVSRLHRRWPNRDTGSNSDSNSDFESDNEVA